MHIGAVNVAKKMGVDPKNITVDHNQYGYLSPSLIEIGQIETAECHLIIDAFVRSSMISDIVFERLWLSC